MKYIMKSNMKNNGSVSVLKIPKINKPKKMKKSKSVLAFGATERLYYQDSIRRIVK